MNSGPPKWFCGVCSMEAERKDRPLYGSVMGLRMRVGHDRKEGEGHLP